MHGAGFWMNNFDYDYNDGATNLLYLSDGTQVHASVAPYEPDTLGAVTFFTEADCRGRPFLRYWNPEPVFQGAYHSQRYYIQNKTKSAIIPYSYGLKLHGDEYLTDLRMTLIGKYDDNHN